MNITSKISLAIVLMFFSSAHAEQTPKVPSPVVAVQLKPAPSQLKAKMKGREILASGTAPFGPNASSIWVVCLAKAKNDKADILEFWKPLGEHDFGLLKKLDLPPLPHRLHPKFILDSKWSDIDLRWLFPQQRRGPVVVVPSANDDYEVVYTFEEGWHDPKPIIQKLDAKFGASGAYLYDFNSINREGILEGSMYVPYQVAEPSDPSGEDDRVNWKRGQGWK